MGKFPIVTFYLQIIILTMQRNFVATWIQRISLRRSISCKLSTSLSSLNRLSAMDWIEEAELHKRQMFNLLYPSGQNIATRRHTVHDHPIYNFLHRYYRYSVNDLLSFSPGFDVPLECTSKGKHMLNPNYLSLREVGDGVTVAVYSLDTIQQKISPEKKLGKINLGHSWQTLKNSLLKPPFYGCFGFHEWAMLYSGGEAARQGKAPGQMAKHQDQLSLRVPQDIIDSVVEANPIRCTHFDAWRFFHPTAQAMNVLNPQTRQTQIQSEQPGCIHANMDLFKYSFQLYPYVSSSLLRQALKIAIRARKIDIRASPYDCSHIDEVKEEGPIYVETKEGRIQYIREQEALFQAAFPIRKELYYVYSTVLGY